MSPLVNQRLRISPPHTPRTRRQARPVHVARARTDTEHPQPQPGLSEARGARWGRRPASPAPSSGEQASRSPFYPPLLHVSADRGLALLCLTLLAGRVIGDGRNVVGVLATARRCRAGFRATLWRTSMLA